ncbi:trypsin-like serine protease [Vibrio sp. RE86]|uniref:S1 family peptidase n=1 Tax=Vibrio sp. RE86 TaxID=2607605 RepID=UPI0014939225|nr:trypsin-like serine protease [Vibrio sp. RE86]NOH78802.1 trypsin-like serine protease [Vibrio sp. RE86]
MSKVYWSLPFLLFFSSSYAVEPTPFIVNGATANIANYPSFASLFYRSNTLYSRSPYCGATMINDQFALTAAHCIYGDDDLMLNTVVVPQLEDESNFLSAEQAQATAFYYPDTYDDSSATLWRDDIAIIKLETRLSVGDYRSLLNTSANDTFSDSDEFKAVGHGYIEGNVAGGTLLLDAALTYTSTESCQQSYGSNLTSKQLCFEGELQGSYRNSTCSGDSGGPVYWYSGGQYIQVGVTSFGPATCGDINFPITSVFTDVYDYQNWIARVINGLEQPKAYVVETDGIRSLVTNSATYTAPETVTSSGGSGGGLSINHSLVLFLLLLVRLIQLPSALTPRSYVSYK